MSLKGLEQAIANLNSISNTAVPRASAQAVNRVATRAVSRSVAVVSKDAGATQTGKTTREDKTRHGEKADGNDSREPGQPARDKARYRQRTVIPQKTGQKRGQ